MANIVDYAIGGATLAVSVAAGGLGWSIGWIREHLIRVHKAEDRILKLEASSEANVRWVQRVDLKLERVEEKLDQLVGRIKGVAGS
jgi:hypothetical protein